MEELARSELLVKNDRAHFGTRLFVVRLVATVLVLLWGFWFLT
jgi:hypothetical protein